VITTVAVENYRSLRHLVLPVGRLSVVTGANGSGKSSLYRALRLLADSARNGAVAALAREGGLQSALWAGKDGRRSVALRLGFAGDDFGYAMDLGMPQPSSSSFARDPEIKVEAVWTGPVLRPVAVLAERGGKAVRIRDGAGGWHTLPRLRLYDSMLSEIADPQRAPELLTIREQIRSWRFYDYLRTDTQAPARSAQIGTRTPVLSNDGADLAAALQTIREIGNHELLGKVVDRAFPGSRLEITELGGRFELTLSQPGLLRPLSAAELSDGTLRYLLWVAVLLTPRPPALLVLNEPETSLHPELIVALAELIVAVSADTQVIVVTHAAPLVEALSDRSAQTIELVKDNGETAVAGQGLLDEPLWHWPKR
jgi:predicted ATPase